MKFGTLALTALFSALFFAPSTAGAVALNGGLLIGGGIPKTPYNETTIVDGSGFDYDTATGALANMTKIIFTYDVKIPGKGIGNWNFSLTDLGGNSLTSLQGPETVLNKDKIFTAVLSLVNNTGAAINFKSFLFGNKEALVSSSFRTEALSTVPLPAALPLFGLGLAGLAGYKRLRKTKG